MRTLKAFVLRHLGWIFCTAILIVLVKVTLEVVSAEPISFDRTVLITLRDWLPSTWIPFFKTVTLTGAFAFLAPMTAAIAAVLYLRDYKREAVQIALSMATSGLVIYLAKAVVNRERPNLWDTQWYWGSSFPSGHTLGAAVFATACWLTVSRVSPRNATLAGLVLGIWLGLVGLSRLVLGVHWPTDVIAAACAGLLTASAINYALFHETKAARLHGEKL